MNDQRKAAYQSALNAWRTKFPDDPRWKPRREAFGLSEAEAADVEANGASMEGLPAHLRCAARATGETES